MPATLPSAACPRARHARWEATRHRMDQILETIGDTIGGFFANPIVQLAIQAVAIYFVILWLASAYWAFRDMQQRSENPVLPYLAAALIILFTPVLFVFGVIVYRIVRPHEKIGEVYERNLAEEALLAEVETIKTCPSCSRRVNDEWIICPSCRTRLNRVCANCGRLVGLDWSLCAWCGKDFERSDVASYEPIATEMPRPIEPPSPRPLDEPGTAASVAAEPPVLRSASRTTTLRGAQLPAPQNPSSAPGSYPEP
jgi:RNA polymerase subunit RPABC4/transcription elongation factor Spt4